MSSSSSSSSSALSSSSSCCSSSSHCHPSGPSSSGYILSRSYRANFKCICPDENCLQKNNRDHIRNFLTAKISNGLRVPISQFTPYLTEPLCGLIAEYIEDYAEYTERSVVGSNSTMIAFVNQSYLYGNVKRKEKRKKEPKSGDDEKKKEEKSEKKARRGAAEENANDHTMEEENLLQNNDENDMQTEDVQPMAVPTNASNSSASPPSAATSASSSPSGIGSPSSQATRSLSVPISPFNSTNSSSAASSSSSSATSAASAASSAASASASAAGASASNSRAPPLPAGSVSKTDAWDGSVDIFWLNYHGDRVHYLRLPAAGQFIQQTYATHPWVALRSNDGQHMLINGQYIYFPPRSNISREEEPCVAVITPVPPTLEGQWTKQRKGCEVSCACKCHKEREQDEMEIRRITDVAFKNQIANEQPLPLSLSLLPSASESAAGAGATASTSSSSASASSAGLLSSTAQSSQWHAENQSSHGHKSKKRHGVHDDEHDNAHRDGYDSDVD